MNIEQLYAVFLQHPNISTDTRKIQSGDLYFALKGPSFDGNQFVQNALDAGARYCIADNHHLEKHEQVIVVEDVLTTLQQLAGYHRDQFNIPFIAITGSNGKTTTKELLHAVLSTHYKTYTTEGNLNNHIGIPLTLLKVKQDAEMAIVEMGANHQLEIKSYCEYAKPTHGLITNCGKAHLEGFGSIEGVKKGKGELYDYLLENNGTAFVNAAFDYLVEMSKCISKVITYGNAQTQFYGEAEPGTETLRVKMQNGALIQTQLAGDYNLHNVLAAYAVGASFNVEEENIINAIENYVPGNHRSQWMDWKNNRVLLDAYNANPASMQVAIENFSKVAADRKILALGSMKEMGADSDAEHQNLLNKIAGYKWDAIILVGKEFKNIPAHVHYFDTSEEAGKWLQSQNFINTYILVKGSRGSKMEKILIDQ